jgi:patatin-related protein
MERRSVSAEGVTQSGMEASASSTPQSGDVRELRLAVVLYGGSSLAIYMHGTTKELQRLVKASALADRGVPATTASERVYVELLAEVVRRDPARVRTRVVVDVVAGTSAGGINGVYLSKAIAHNRSQDSLRDLWLERGDIKVLLRGPGWLPPLLKVPLLLAGAVKKPVLKGDAIAQWMYGALADMDRTRSQPEDLETLMPPSHALELFVTVTDFYGYRRDVAIADPKLIGERVHRHVLSFRLGDGVDQFDEAHNGALAFAARTTMSFPGAFPPVSLASFQAAVAREAGDVSPVLPELFRIYALAHADPHATFFIDGGVLDNKPFGHAIDAIKRRAAESEVERRLLYLEPDPGDAGGAAPGGDSPTPIATVLASVSGLPRQEPVLDDILEVNRHNERVLRIQEIVETSFDPIRKRIEEIVGTELDRLTHEQSPGDLVQWRNRINEDAKATAGFAYATYLRSKVENVVDSFARTICRLSDFPDDSNQATFVRGVVRAWADTHLRRDAEGRQAPLDDLVAFLRTFDLAYRARRLRFVTDGLSAWYVHTGEPGYPNRAQLDEGKRMLWEARELLGAVMTGRKLLTNITADVLGIFAQATIDAWIDEGRGPAEYSAGHVDELARLKEEFGKALDARLAGTAETLYAQLFGLSEGWAAERRAELLVRYLGFPYWDVLLFPLQTVSDAGERDTIEVVRMSPRDAKLLPPLDPNGPKQLAGFEKMHFGAFFDRAGRENDYLWGRLDGAERLIGLVLGAEFTDDERTAWCRKAFAAIVEEEDGALGKAKPLLDHARSFAGP